MSKLHDLLNELREKNDSDQYAHLFPQKLAPKAALTAIATLDRKKSYPASPMIAARFSFAARWRNAVAGFTWLSIEEIREVPIQKTTKAQIALRRQYWPDSVMAKTQAAQLSLFAIDKQEDGETYLLWSREDEPKILHYSGHSEYVFKDFRRFVKWLLASE